VEIPAIETAMAGAEASPDDIRPDGADSTRPSAFFFPRVRTGGVSVAGMGTKCTDRLVPRVGTPSHLHGSPGPPRHSRDFRRLWIGQAISGIGSQLTLVAVAFQAFHLTHSTLVVGMIGFTQLLPLLSGALWGGTLADAWDRRRVLTLTQVAMAVAVAGLAVNAALDHPQAWVLFVCTAAAAGFQGMDWPARRAALPMLVTDDDVDAAVAL